MLFLSSPFTLMELVRLRCVLTGACHPAYSGKQIEFNVPTKQTAGSLTTIGEMVQQIREQWPADCSEMAESARTAKIKVLRAGRLLAPTDVFAKQLTRTELEECELHTSSSSGELVSKSAVLMHLVFQRDSPAALPRKAKGSPLENRKSTPPEEDCCCIAM